MFAGVPSIVREGLNYGHHYPFINDQTGGYASERDLPGAILRMLERCGQMHPREWVMQHMSCQRATEVLSATIQQFAVRQGEPWTADPVVKVRHLHRMVYWDESHRQRLDADYDWLTSAGLREGRAA
jgi:hypothetical protein